MTPVARASYLLYHVSGLIFRPRLNFRLQQQNSYLFESARVEAIDAVLLASYCTVLGRLGES